MAEPNGSAFFCFGFLTRIKHAGRFTEKTVRLKNLRPALAGEGMISFAVKKQIRILRENADPTHLSGVPD